MSRFAFVIALLLVVPSTGCQVYDPSLVHQDAGNGGMCVGRRPPPRPDMPDGDDVDELFFGLRDVLLNQGGRWSDIGFNLDGYCTGSPDFGHECKPPQAGARPEPDGSDGIDNTFGGRLYPLVETAIPGLESTAREAQLEGIGFPAFRLRGWNGEANDPRVNVMITQAVASVAANEDGSQPDVVIRDYRAELASGGPAPPPEWDGTDYFWARADTFLAGDPEQPLVYDDNAYIADDTIVINLPDRVEILFATADAGVTVRLTGGLVTGHISSDRMHVEDVIVGGRWSVVDLLRTAENVGLCMGTFQYNGLEAMLKGIVDVRSEPGSGGPDVECDAVSLGVGFTGFRLRFAGVAEGRTLRNVCAEMRDGGVGDGGSSDAGSSDAGSSMPDAGVPIDAGSADAGAGSDGG